MYYRCLIILRWESFQTKQKETKTIWPSYDAAPEKILTILHVTPLVCLYNVQQKQQSNIWYLTNWHLWWHFSYVIAIVISSSKVTHLKENDRSNHLTSLALGSCSHEGCCRWWVAFIIHHKLQTQVVVMIRLFTW